MAVKINTNLTDAQIEEMESIPAKYWFTRFQFNNAESPEHPNPKFPANNEMKQRMVADWIEKYVPGKRVLDLFSANGGFSALAALAGAREVVGLDYEAESVRIAEFVARVLEPLVDCDLRFVHGDVYDMRKYFDEPFDVVLCFGGLYHIADPAFVLRETGALTKERLLLQTTKVLSTKRNVARFVVRRAHRGQDGKPWIHQGYGTWHYSPACLHQLLLHGDFKVVDERIPGPDEFKRFPWFVANCERLYRATDKGR
jgi:2-polyprenyl-3-methyl-5-hydroxy-6-metoxy-1,4-benzoquinol methylase